MGIAGDTPWTRYELGEIIRQHQRISRTEAKQIPSGMPVWVDKVSPYYGDHPDGLRASREYLLRHARVAHPVLPAIVDAWEHEGSLSWVYRAQQGTPLGQYVAEHTPTLPALEPLVIDMACGFQALHKADLYHGSLDSGNVLVAGRRRLVFARRGIRDHLNDMLNRSPLEGEINTAPVGDLANDVALWGELLGVLLTGEEHFGRVLVSDRSVGTIDAKQAAETLRRKGITGRIPEVIVRAVRARQVPGESYLSVEEALSAFREALAYDRGSAGGPR